MIALNSGTTNVILAQELIKRFTDLTIVTNNVSAADGADAEPSRCARLCWAVIWTAWSTPLTAASAKESLAGTT